MEEYYIQRQKYLKELSQYPWYYDNTIVSFHNYWNHLSYYGKLRLSKGLPLNDNRITRNPEYILGQIFGDEGYWKLVAGFKKKL